MKKRIILCLVVAMVLSFATGVIGKSVYENIKAQIRSDFIIEIDGQQREFKNVNGERVYPVLYDGTTYLPIRAIGEIMNKKVYWYEDEKRVELKDDKDLQKTTVTDADVIIAGDTGLIGKEKAKKIALDKAGFKESEVVFDKVTFDKESGILVYEIEFKKNGKEYSAEIKADDGTIIDWEVDIDD